MQHNRRIYVVGGSDWDDNWMQGKRVYTIEKSNLVVFPGGDDINPELYHKKAHKYTHFNRRRDQLEVEAFNKALSLNKKILGICRGAQLLCAMAGGILVQDQRHPSVHKMHTQNDGDIWVTSAHHQRQYPWGTDFELIGWCDKLSPWNDGENMDDELKGKPEVEIAIYPKINSLAIQSHPEWAYPAKAVWEEKYIAFCQKLLSKHMKATYEVQVAA